MYRVLACLLCLISLSSCGKKKPERGFSVPVTAMKVVPQKIPADFQFVAVAESSHIVEIRARVEGYLEKISYDEGKLVEENDLLFTLDQRPFIASLDIAKGELDQKEAVLWNAQQTKNRMVPLYKQNAVSQRDLDNALASEYAAEADVRSAKAAVYKNQVNLSYTEIRAPVTGMASRAIFREGALISPGPDSLLTRLFVIDPIWVNFNVSEGQILQLQDEKRHGKIVLPQEQDVIIEVVMPNGDVFPAEGKIDFLDPALQQSTGTMLVRSIMKNPGRILRPGMFVNVVVKGAYRPNAIVVPQTAVQMGQGGTFVYVIAGGKYAEVRPVVVGDWFRDYWIIEEGLKEGDEVISLGVNKVVNGGPVTVTHRAPSVPPEPIKKKQQPNMLGY
ncbi:MAG: efflux RND transporter periplasmic adaptor subunit [Simkaniaceae bacterium]|nr:efflux RND transporter periplasmic adaptor subunit [Simkaniaceae bacterium]